MPPEVVEVIAARENWAAKLKNMTAERRRDGASRTDREIDQAASLRVAQGLREVIDRVLTVLSNLHGRKTILTLVTRRDPRTGRQFVDLQPLCHLVTAALTVQAMTTAAVEEDPGQLRLDPKDAEILNLQEALTRGMNAVDQFKGLDSATIVRDRLDALEGPAPVPGAAVEASAASERPLQPPPGLTSTAQPPLKREPRS